MSDISNCALGFKCHKKWDDLKPLSNLTTRYCTECGDKVHLCETDEEIVTNIRMNNCIAVSCELPLVEGTLGIPLFFPPLSFAISNPKVIEKLEAVNIKDFEKICQFTRADLTLVTGLTEFEMLEIDEFMSSRNLAYDSDDE